MKERITRTQRLLGETQVYVILTVAKVSWVYTQMLKLIKLHFKCVQFTAFQLQLSEVAGKKRQLCGSHKQTLRESAPPTGLSRHHNTALSGRDVPQVKWTELRDCPALLRKRTQGDSKTDTPLPRRCLPQRGTNTGEAASGRVQRGRNPPDFDLLG